MEISTLHNIALNILEWITLLLVLGVATLLVMVIYFYIVDSRQQTHTIRRNYPVIGRFRYLFEHLGEFFRQYFFAMDREELPFNRAERSWVYRAAKEVDSTIAFGSTRPMDQEGDINFLNSAFPVLEDEALPVKTIIVGEHHCPQPYHANSVLNISAMSYGAISAPAVQALSCGARMAGIWMNTGEGGLSPHHLQEGCDIVFQIGTAKYGVRDNNGGLDDAKLLAIAAHAQVRMFEIKLSQGAKPGKGGILPGAKVTEEIAHIRNIPAGMDSLSPNAHPEFKNVGDILDMVERVRTVTGKPTGLKFVVGQTDFLHTLFQEIHRRGVPSAPDFLTIDSADGGTGAAPQALMDFMGLPIRESLPLVVDLLHEYGLRERIKVIASGKLISPDKVAWALCVGADFCASARGFMFALGCIQALQCNKNTCPTGITTHNKELQKGLVSSEKAKRVSAYAKHVAAGVNMIAHSCGVLEPRSLGREHVTIILRKDSSRIMRELDPIPATRSEYIQRY